MYARGNLRKKKVCILFVCWEDLQSTSFAFGDDDHVLRRGWERLSVLVSIRWNSVFTMARVVFLQNYHGRTQKGAGEGRGPPLNLWEKICFLL